MGYERTAHIRLVALLCILIALPSTSANGDRPQNKKSQPTLAIIDREIVAPIVRDIATKLAPVLVEKARFYIELWAQRLSAPESCSVPYTCSTRQDIATRLKSIATDVAGSLLPSGLDGLLAELTNLHQSLRENQAKLDVARDHIIDAPDDVPWYDYISSSKRDYQRRMDDIVHAIAVLHPRIDSKSSELAKFINERSGIRLSPSHISDLLSYVGGRDMLRSMIALSVASELATNFRKRISDTPSAPVAIRWYDVQVLLMQSIVQMHQEHLRLYDDTWIPKAKTIEDVLGEKRDEYGKKAKNAKVADNRSIFEANKVLAVKALAELHSYQALLQEQRKGVLAAFSIAKESLEALEATRDTAKTLAELSDLMRRTTDTYNLIVNVQLPNFRPVGTDLERKALRATSARLGN